MLVYNFVAFYRNVIKNIKHLSDFESSISLNEGVI